MNEMVKAEYLSTARKVFETDLNGSNIIKWINIWSVFVLRYYVVFIDWNCA